jgi:gluconolactonase
MTSPARALWALSTWPLWALACGSEPAPSSAPSGGAGGVGQAGAGSTPDAGAGGLGGRSGGTGGGGTGGATGGSAAETGGGAGIGGVGGTGGDGGSTLGGAAGGGASGGGAGPAGGAGATGGGPPASGGAAGAGGGGLGWFTCPAPPFAAAPVPSGAAAERVAGVPPADDFIASENDIIILEGPVWLDGNLYLSEIDQPMSFGGPGFGGRGGFPGAGGAGAGAGGMGGAGGRTTEAPKARVLKVTAEGTVSVALPDAGTNGLAVDASGNLIGCSHKTGSVARLSLEGGAPVDLVATYMDSRFGAPNDLTFGTDGTLYFTDPDYQAPSPLPQAATRAYRVAPGTKVATPIADGLEQPNGITLSPDRKTLYVSNPSGVYAHPVMADGSVGSGTRFAQSALQSSDGMAVDCAGNLYATSGQSVTIVSAAGAEVGRITVSGVQQVTNVAFGGPEQKTLFITALGSGSRAGLFKLASEIPGMPY